MLPFRKASVLQIGISGVIFLRALSAPVTLTCADQFHPRAPLAHAQHGSSASAQVLAALLARAGLQVSLSRALTLCYCWQLPGLTSDVPWQEGLAQPSQGRCCPTLAAASRPSLLFCPGSCVGTSTACLLPLVPLPLHEPPALAAPSQPAWARTRAQLEPPGPWVEGTWLGPQVGLVWATSAYRQVPSGPW